MLRRIYIPINFKRLGNHEDNNKTRASFYNDRRFYLLIPSVPVLPGSFPVLVLFRDLSRRCWGAVLGQTTCQIRMMRRLWAKVCAFINEYPHVSCISGTIEVVVYLSCSPAREGG